MNGQFPKIKCLVWDLDNTLWTGTLLEDAHVVVPDAMRTFIELLDKRGIVQSIASKNDFDLAWARVEDLGLAKYFLIPQIGWAPKSHSIREICKKFNFASNTIAFVDDQPQERAEVEFHLPDVRCYAPAEIESLAERREFNPSKLTADSKRRRLMYQASFQRDDERKSYIGADHEFVRSLQLKLSISNVAIDLARVEELTLRTSQMNATGIHYSENDLFRMRESPDHEVLMATLADRFGDYGAIGIVLLEKLDFYWRIKLLATSCRVVSLGVGSVILNWIINAAADAGVHLLADFRRTERNRMMEIAYRFAGLGESNCSCILEGITRDGELLLHMVPQKEPLRAAMTISAPTL